MMKEYMFDSLKQSGRGNEGLSYAASLCDKHTETRQIDFADMNICHYLGRGNGKLSFVEISEDGRVRVSLRKDGRYNISAGRQMDLDIDGFRKEHLVKLVNEVVNNEESCGTIFHNTEDMEAAEFYFTSRACRKTMQLRLALEIPVSSLERDIMIRKTLYDQITKPLWVVARRDGNYAKIISMFANDPERIPFSRVAEFAKNDAQVISWELTQVGGLKIMFSVPEEMFRIAVSYPDIEYIPMHIIQVCDSGHYSNTIASGWCDINNPESWFCINRTPIMKGDLAGALEQSRAMIEMEAMQLCSEASLESSVLDQIDFLSKKSGLAKISARTVAAYKQAAIESGGIVNRRQLIRLFANGIGNVENISNYAETEIRSRILGQIINNIA